ncbi:hypothetical protein C8R42DRAFT_553095, partial [Lentinula raphanica]
LAKVTGVHRHTLRQYLKKNGINYQFATLTDEQLDTITRLFKASKVNSGLRYLHGFLNMHGLRVQRR